MMSTYLEEACESIDASVFSSDMLFCDTDRQMLKEYAERWLRANAEHEADDSGEVKPSDTERLNWIEDECRKHGRVDIGRNATELFSITTQRIRAPSLRKLLDKAAVSVRVKP